MTSNAYINKLKQNKDRVTPGRRKIVEIFCNKTYPLTAEMLIKKTKMNKTSIYRELKFLLDQKFIQEVNFGDMIKRYELKDRKHHHHLICLKCKKIQDINFKENLEWQEDKINKEQKFHVLRHYLEFFGYCQNCINK